MRGPKNSLSDIVIDTGPLLLPLTQEPGWNKIKKLLELHEKGKLTIHIGLLNISELIYAMYRLGYDMETSLRYAILVSNRLKVIKDIRYIIWMGRLRVSVHDLKYNIPWGDISSAAAALSMNIPVIVLDEDKHFDEIALICSKLGKSIQVLRIKDLNY
ncbi:MAG: hypothetical protein DRJ66_06910 [Thermoprotei archaeon]|nr:MAG: hypothetical protein DRJ66_06910 [Thermoprotei archaeon]RLF17899.1 MAG: hypothetical protein DRZ82_09255 [Thermoprotei archaeon]